MGESGSSALLYCSVRYACKQDCQEDLTQEFSVLIELTAPGTELYVIQWLSVVKVVFLLSLSLLLVSVFEH